MHVGKRPPQEGKQLGRGKGVTAAWLQRRERFAQFMVANFVPWEQGGADDLDGDACKPPPLTPATLLGWQAHLSEVAEKDWRADDRCIARGRLFAMRQHVHALSVDVQTKKMLTQLRFRNRDTWPDGGTDGDGHGHGHGGQPKTMSKEEEAAEAHVQQMLAQQKAQQASAGRLEHAANQERWASEMLKQMGAELPPVDDTPRSASRARAGGEQLGTLECSRALVAARFKELKKAPASEAAAPAEDGAPDDAPGDAPAPAAPSIGELHMPERFLHLPPNAMKAKVEEWEAQVEAAEANKTPPPPPPLSNEQRDVARAVFPTLFEMARAKAEVGGARENWSRAVGDVNRLFLMSGPAGSGKTEVIKATDQVMQEQHFGTMVLSAFTGSAVVSLENATTLITLLGLGREAGYLTGEIRPPDEKQISTFKMYVGENYKRELMMIVIDEVSFLNGTILEHVNKRLQQLMDCTADFGGLVLLCAGDFFQKPSTMGVTLHKALVRKHCAVPNENGYVPKKRKPTGGGAKELQAEAKGVALFEKLLCFKLRATHRFRKDPTHGDNLNEMRDMASKQPVSGGFLASLVPLSEEEKRDASWMFARVGVVSNLERHQINAARALQFAKHHSRVLIRWKRSLTGAAARSMDSSVRDALFEEEHGLWDYFVPGAPAVMNENLMQAKGLVNGTPCTMHSLVLSESSPDDLQALLASAGPGGVVTLSKPPEFINVELTELSPVFAGRLRPSSLLDDKLVVSIPMRSSVDEFVPSSQYAAQHGIGVKVRVPGSKAKKTLLDIKQHMVELAFAVTDFKLQGKSVDRLVLSLAPRPPNTEPTIKLDSLYVLASRVRTRQGLRVLMADTNHWAHLRALRHPPELEIWEKAYDPTTRKFSPQLASEAAMEVAERLQAEKKEEAAMGEKRPAPPRAPGARKSQKTAPARPAGSGAFTARGLKPAADEAAAGRQATEGQAAKRKLSPQPRGLSPQLRSRPAPRGLSPQLRSRPAGGGALRGGTEAQRWLQSASYLRNSCWIDAPAKAWHVGQLARADYTQQPVLQGFYPPVVEQAADEVVGEAPARAADVGGALYNWLLCAQRTAFEPAFNLREAVGQLSVARDNLRREVLRAQEHISYQRARAPKRGEAAIAGCVHAKMQQMGPAVEAMRYYVGMRAHATRASAVQSAATREPDFLGGVPRPRQCGSCRAEIERTDGDTPPDARVHYLTPDQLQLSRGNVLAAFANRYCVPQQYTSHMGASRCQACGSEEKLEPGWFDESCLAPDASPLLAVWWDTHDVNGGHTKVSWDAAGRDDAVLTTPAGEAGYKLVALVYFSPTAKHFITVHRGDASGAVLSATSWFCYDDTNRGVSEPLPRPPDGGTIKDSFRPVMAIYCRRPHTATGGGGPASPASSSICSFGPGSDDGGRAAKRARTAAGVDDAGVASASAARSVATPVASSQHTASMRDGARKQLKRRLSPGS